MIVTDEKDLTRINTFLINPSTTVLAENSIMIMSFLHTILTNLCCWLTSFPVKL